jgi:hypothetical protein
VSHDILGAVTDFFVNQDLKMPSDHAPIAVSLDLELLGVCVADEIKQRASLLGVQQLRDDAPNKNFLQKQAIKSHEVQHEQSHSTTNAQH